MLCGDIESNPGTTIEEFLDDVLVGQRSIQATFDAIKTKIKEIKASALVYKEVNGKVSRL